VINYQLDDRVAEDERVLMPPASSAMHWRRQSPIHFCHLYGSAAPYTSGRCTVCLVVDRSFGYNDDVRVGGVYHRTTRRI